MPCVYDNRPKSRGTASRRRRRSADTAPPEAYWKSSNGETVYRDDDDEFAFLNNEITPVVSRITVLTRDTAEVQESVSAVGIPNEISNKNNFEEAPCDSSGIPHKTPKISASVSIEATSETTASLQVESLQQQVDFLLEQNKQQENLIRELQIEKNVFYAQRDPLKRHPPPPEKSPQVYDVKYSPPPSTTNNKQDHGCKAKKNLFSEKFDDSKTHNEAVKLGDEFSSETVPGEIQKLHESEMKRLQAEHSAELQSLHQKIEQSDENHNHDMEGTKLKYAKDLESRQRELDECKENIETLRAENLALKNKQKEVLALIEKQSDERNNGIMESSMHAKELEDRQREIDELKENIEELKVENISLKKEQEEIQVLKENYQKDICNLSISFDNKSKEIEDSYKREIESLRKSWNEKEEDLNQNHTRQLEEILKEARKDYKNSIDIRVQEIELLEKEVKVHKHWRQRYLERAIRRKERIQGFQEMNNSIITDYEILENTHEELVKKYEMLKETHKELLKKYRMLEKTHEELEKSLKERQSSKSGNLFDPLGLTSLFGKSKPAQSRQGKRSRDTNDNSGGSPRSKKSKSCLEMLDDCTTRRTTRSSELSQASTRRSPRFNNKQTSAKKELTYEGRALKYQRRRSEQAWSDGVLGLSVKMNSPSCDSI